jgi:hypothetical protein
MHQVSLGQSIADLQNSQPRLHMGRMGFEVYSRNGKICRKNAIDIVWDKTGLSDGNLISRL